MRCGHFRHALLGSALATVLASAAPAAGAERRVKLEGHLLGDELIVEELKERDPRRDVTSGQLAGTVDAIDLAARRLELGPIGVEWTPETPFEGVEPAAVGVGSQLEVEGVLIAPRRIRATRISAASLDQGHFEILGAVSRYEPDADGGELLVVLGVGARVPATLRASPVALAHDPDNRRPEDQLSAQLFGRPLTLGGELGTKLEFLGDRALDDDEEDDKLGLEEELQLELFYPWSSRVAFFLVGKAAHERELWTEDGVRDRLSSAERGESWAFVAGPEASGLALQLGRQAWREEREWWWDADLDAVRLWWTRFPFGFQLGVAKELLPASTEFDGIDPEQEDVLRYLGRATWSWLPNHRLDLFGLVQQDDSGQPRLGARVEEDEEDFADGDLQWFGLRSSGELELRRSTKLGYWLDVAHVGGREKVYTLDDDDLVDSRTRQRVSGWGADVGTTLALPFVHDPALTLGYAFGTENFRQTGLQDDNGKFRGVDRFRYYGELLDPELSNLHVATASFGFRFWSSSSVELLYHFYRQQQAAPFLRDTKLDADPLGNSKTLGQELDLVVGLEEWEHVEVELIGAAFRAGSAFGPLSGEYVYGAFLKIDLNF